LASVRPTPTGRYELTIRNKLLPRRVYLTFDTEAEATRYGEQVERLLAQGVVPRGLVPDTPVTRRSERVSTMLLAWLNTGQPAPSDVEVLRLLIADVGDLDMTGLTYAWAEGWVAGMKRIGNLAPSTIRKRVGSLSRAIDWWLRTHPDVNLGNPLKLLPRGASVYTVADKAAAVAGGGVVKVDASRDHRVTGKVLDAIVDALNGAKRPDRERPVVHPDDVEFRTLFWTIFYTGLRLREAYTLQTDNVDMTRRTILARTSKQWHEKVLHRSIPIRPQLVPHITAWHAQRPAGSLLFTFWSGDPADLKRTTARLSARFSNLFAYAGHPEITEHDLRHEATCQWLELRDSNGQWVFRNEEIDRIMGWAAGSEMSKRYASFRAEDLASRLWPSKG
jgi:integrase